MSNNDPFTDLIRSIEENLQGGGDDVTPPEDGTRSQPEVNPRRILWFVLPFLLLIFFNRVVGFYGNWLWYDSLGFANVFFTRIYASIGLFLAGAIFFWLFLALNVLLARRLEPNGLRGTPVEQAISAFGLRVTPVVLFAGAIIALMFGGGASSAWEEVLIYFNQTSFSLADPIFGRDVSFFMFTLPVWEALRGWLMTTLIFSLIATALVSGIGWRGWDARTRVLAHLSILGALILLLIAWQYRLDAFNLVYSTRGAIYGAGFTDENAQLPVYNILSIVTAIAAILLVVTAFLRRAWRAIVAVLVIWVAVAVLAGNVYPGFVQRFQVAPNELNRERPYIENNISFTRIAFGLDEITVRDYAPSGNLKASDLLADSETVLNVRLWDYRPLLQTYNQIQALRQYYEFNDIDVDRYVIDGDVTQVMLAARELVPDRLNDVAQTWVNQKLVYTHGYGVAASPVSQVTRDGLPDFYLKDLPPQGVLEITRPQIYFGELTDSYVIVRTNEPEFDYPRGDGNVTTRFDADTGIDMSIWARILFALRFADINMLLNQDITSDSQLLWRRNMQERIHLVAPFLLYDRDPYIVVSDDGGLFWFQDAYTFSDSFPYSNPENGINYIRNSVKVVTNAYDGTMKFYMVDESEPIIAAYAKIFPDLFVSIDEMPLDLLDNVRYPSDLFTIQSEVYRTYHMIDVNEFYNREDVWQWPEEIFDSQAQPMEPYYVLMELPDAEGEIDTRLEFVQILPFTPANRENMIAWMAARSDPAEYGEKLVYEFGKDSLFFGPKQVEARIDQDPTISAQLSLWNQEGSNVIRGNLLVIPLAGDLLYVEPLYLQAASGRIPELKQVIVATADRVKMATNFGLALVALFGEQLLEDADLASLATFGEEIDGPIDLAALAASTETAISGEDATVLELVTEANARFNQAQEYAQSGDWAGYGAEIEALQEILDRLTVLVGVPTEAIEGAPVEGETLEDAESAPEQESNAESGS